MNASTIATGTLIVAALLTPACGLQGEARQSERPGSLISPRSAEIVRCWLDPDHVYRFHVNGIMPDLSRDQRLLLWVEPVSPPSETAGWYLQRGFNGIMKFNPTNGEFRGIGQIGNPAWPPHVSDTLNVAITAVDAKEASLLLSEPGVVTRRSLPGTVLDAAWKARVGL